MNHATPYVLPKLPYATTALAPHIDARTMEIHHSKHHQTYVNNLNAVVGGTTWGALPVEQLITRLNELPADQKSTVQNNGGGHANHTLFWTVMAPTGQGGGGAPGAHVGAALVRDVGGVERFQKTFAQAALARFGSGWAWLTVDKNGKLAVEHTGNQDSPLMPGVSSGNTPILGLDVWEHAYYLQYQNRRPDYVAAFFNVVNWAEVERRYAAALVQ